MEDSKALKDLSNTVQRLHNFMSDEFGVTELTVTQHTKLVEIISSTATAEYFRGHEEGSYRILTDVQRILIDYVRAVVPQLMVTTNKTDLYHDTNDVPSDDDSNASSD